MRLRVDAPDFAHQKLHGTAVVWTTMYRTVFSLVKFTAGNVATCIAPGCRRFRGRCGHVKIACPLNSKWTDGSGEAAAQQRLLTLSTTRRKVAVPGGALFLVSEEEDMGVERLPSDTVRAKSDPATDHLARRVIRNLPPCARELNDGEAWARKADWKSLYNKRASRCDEKRAVDLKAMDELFSQHVC